MAGCNHRAGCCCGVSAPVKLVRCSITCADCGSGTSTIYPSNRNLAQYIGKVVKIAGDADTCYAVQSYSVYGAENVIVTDVFDTCGECCDTGYECGDCEFYPNSKIEFECYYHNCSGLDKPDKIAIHSHHLDYTLDRYTWNNCSEWRADFNSMYDWRPNQSVCAFHDDGVNDMPVQVLVSYNCTTNKWYFTIKNTYSGGGYWVINQAVYDSMLHSCGGATWDSTYVDTAKDYERMWGSITVIDNP